jgi:hypothetical protein
MVEITLKRGASGEFPLIMTPNIRDNSSATPQRGEDQQDSKEGYGPEIRRSYNDLG